MSTFQKILLSLALLIVVGVLTCVEYVPAGPVPDRKIQSSVTDTTLLVTLDYTFNLPGDTPDSTIEEATKIMDSLVVVVLKEEFKKNKEYRNKVESAFLDQLKNGLITK